MNRILNASPMAYFQGLFWAQVAGLVRMILSAVAGLEGIAAVLSLGIGAVTAFCLLMLAKPYTAYMNAGLLSSIAVLCSAMIHFGFGALFLLAGSFASLLAAFFEYKAHASMVLEERPELSKKWRSLFWLEILVNLLVSFSSGIAAAWGTFTGISTDSIALLVTICIHVATVILELIYLSYLKQTMHTITDTVD